MYVYTQFILFYTRQNKIKYKSLRARVLYVYVTRRLHIFIMILAAAKSHVDTPAPIHRQWIDCVVFGIIR